MIKNAKCWSDALWVKIYKFLKEVIILIFANYVSFLDKKVELDRRRIQVQAVVDGRQQ